MFQLSRLGAIIVCLFFPFLQVAGMGLHFCYLFTDSPIVFSVHLLEDQIAGFESFLQKAENAILREPRIRFVTYICKEGSFFSTNYPINILRNLGIFNVKTSHFIVLDMDMWMSSMKHVEILTCRKLL